MDKKEFSLEEGFDWWLKQRGMVKEEIPNHTLKEMQRMFNGGVTYLLCFELDSVDVLNKNVVRDLFAKVYLHLSEDIQQELFENLKKQDNDKT